MPKEITQSAAELAVGADDPVGDWKLMPDRHAAGLKVPAGALKRVLEAPGIMSIMSRYTERDAEANTQQKIFRDTMKRVRWLAYSAAASGLIALSLRVYLEYVHDIQPAVVFLHVVCLLWLAFEIARLNRRDPRTKWLAARGEAEQLRVALFEKVREAKETPAAGELPLLPLQLAYFRRYQLDVQLRYFKGRGRELVRPADLSPWLTRPAVIAASTALVTALVLAIHVAAEYGLSVPDLALLSTRLDYAERIALWVFPFLFVSTLYAVVVSQHSVSEDARNGSRYLALEKNLAYLKAEAYEDVRVKAEDGDRETVARFVGLVHDLMIAEQTQWISFQGMVEKHDNILAGQSAKGLAELFAGRLEKRP